MPAYVFHLHDGAAVTPLDETVAAEDLEEAHDLAQLRLLLSTRFTHVEVFEDGVMRLKLEREGTPPGARPDENRDPG